MSGITLDKRKDIAGDKVIIEGGSDGTSIGNVGDSLKVIGSEEDSARLEAGQAFTVSMQYLLNNGQTVYQSFKTPNTSTRIKIRYKTYSTQRTQISVYENPTGATYSFPWTPQNRNRELNTASTVVIQAVSSQTTIGSFFYTEANYGLGYQVAPSPIQISQWLLLDQNTEYFFAMNSSNASNLCTVQLQWYEVP